MGDPRPSETGDEVLEKQDEYLFPAVITYYDDPLPIERAKGTAVYDFDGNEYLDFFGGILTISVGHANDDVNDAVKEQVDELGHVSTLYPTGPQADLAETLAGIAPGDISKSFFTNSGTEADETAIMAAKIATNRNEIVALRHSYSGRSMLAVTMTGHAPWRVLGDQIPGVKHALAPYCYRCPLNMTYPECGVACAEDVEELIRTTTPGKIAAFIAEPIMGVGGFITPPPEYFEIVAEITRRYGGYFIADEVQTGLGRTGEHWWGIEHWDVEPDIITAAKGIANGVPLGVTMATPEVADAWEGLTISTFGGNPVSTRAASATLDVIEEGNLLQNAELMGARLRRGLEDLQETVRCIGDVRGKGLMQAIELVEDRETKEPATDVIHELFEETKRRGLLIGKGGLYGNVVRIAPPLTVEADEIDRALQVLTDAFEAIGA